MPLPTVNHSHIILLSPCAAVGAAGFAPFTSGGGTLLSDQTTPQYTVADATSVAPCPVGFWCPGGNILTAGMPVKCAAGLTTAATQSTSEAACGEW
jgi:hypothetical protein